MANGDRDYWKDKYEQEVLGKPKPKEYTVKGFVTVDEVCKDAMKTIVKVILPWEKK